MVKLIHLTTTNTNAHFKANFDTNININPNSKIALKNITFESSFGSFTANGNSKVSFLGSGQVANTFYEQIVEPGGYDLSNARTFFNEVAQALNRTISLLDGKVYNRGHVELYGEFRLRLNTKHNIRIEFRQSSAMNIQSNAYNQDDYGVENPFSATSLSWNQPSYPNNQYQLDNPQELYLADTATPTDDERYYFVPRFGLGLSKGAGVFYCRILNSVANGVTPTKNGFSIGLSFGNPRMPDDIGLAVGVADSERNCEITFQDKTTNYFYRSSKKGLPSVETDSGFLANDVDSANIGQHDILMFKIDNNLDNVKSISAYIYDFNGGTGRERLLFSQTLSDEELLGTITPYIYMRGTKDNIKLDMLRFTPDPFFLIDDMNIPISTQPGKCDDVIGYVLNETDYNFDNSQSITNPIAEVIKQTVAINYDTKYANNLFSDNQGYFPKPDLFIAGELSEALGLNKTGDTSNFNLATRFPNFNYNSNFNTLEDPLNSNGFEIDAPYETIFTKNDSYILETLSLPLLSYNSSIRFTNNIADNRQTDGNRQTSGSRRNILATIPFSSENGLVQYEPNEIIYIDIDNNEKMNLRNIELRILDSNFDPIRIIGVADMTLLISD